MVDKWNELPLHKFALPIGPPKTGFSPRFDCLEIIFPDFIKSVGHSVGQFCPTNKKGARFYSNSLNLLGVLKGI